MYHAELFLWVKGVDDVLLQQKNFLWLYCLRFNDTFLEMGNYFRVVKFIAFIITSWRFITHTLWWVLFWSICNYTNFNIIRMLKSKFLKRQIYVLQKQSNVIKTDYLSNWLFFLINTLLLSFNFPSFTSCQRFSNDTPRYHHHHRISFLFRSHCVLNCGNVCGPRRRT